MLKSASTQIHFSDAKSAKPLYSKQKSASTQIDITRVGLVDDNGDTFL